MRKLSVSNEMKAHIAESKNGRVEFYSFFPIDRADCLCHKKISDWKKKLAKLSEQGREREISEQKHLTCPRDKSGMKRYRITCNSCGQTMGYCWAKDRTLKDWCDFHYISWADDKGWHGCLTPHVSPITEQLCFECTCGQDTRDFRANRTLPAKVSYRIEKENAKGRDFGKKDSKFKADIVDNNVIPFKR